MGSAVFGIWLGIVVFASYTVTGVLMLIYLIATKHFRSFLYMWLVWTLSLPIAVQIGAGGYTKANTMLWAMIVPVIVAVLLDFRQVLLWYSVFALAVISIAVFDYQIAQIALVIPSEVFISTTVFNLVVVPAVLLIIIRYLVVEMEKARARADSLLLAILPASIAEQLKERTETIADSYQEATILFADIVDFTRMSADADPIDVVNMLNTVFLEFDELATKHGVEKIKTIGDAYMVAGGLPTPREDHCEAVLAFAFDMLDAIGKYRAWNDEPVRLRVGINTGPVVAGVIGQQKFIYDVWGDTVNTASRMESNGLTNVIQVTESVYKKMKDRLEFDEREPIHVKGKGETVTYLLRPLRE